VWGRRDTAIPLSAGRATHASLPNTHSWNYSGQQLQAMKPDIQRYLTAS